jgi:hypothetical protein
MVDEWILCIIMSSVRQAFILAVLDCLVLLSESEVKPQTYQIIYCVNFIII